MFHIFFKVGQRYDGITVDHDLEVSSQPIAERIQVKGSRRFSCKKLLAGDSVVNKMAAVSSFHTTSNVTCPDQLHVSLLQQSIFPALQKRRCDTIAVFMQDGAPLHIARCVKQLLRRHFGDDRIIS